MTGLMVLRQSLRANLATAARSYSTKPADMAERHVKIVTCRKTYANTGSKKPFMFRHCPPSGIEMVVKYIDSAPAASHNTPTVLAVHGSPGHYSDFFPLLQTLSQSGCRVISPVMPGHQFTSETRSFHHTTEERTELLSDWLAELGVSRVDVAMSHSSACYPLLQLWSERHGGDRERSLIKSIALMNPMGHRTVKSMRPAWLSASLAHINTPPWGKKIFKALGGPRILGVDKTKADDTILALQTMHFARVHRMVGLLSKIRESQTPTLVLYAEKDKLIEKEIFHEMLHMLDFDERNACRLDKDGHVVTDTPAGNDWLRVLCVSEGGHYAFKCANDVLHNEIMKMIALVRTKS